MAAILLDISEDELQQCFEEIMTLLGSTSIKVDVEKKEFLIVLNRAFQEFEKETSLWQLKNQFINYYGLPAGMTLQNQFLTFNFGLVNQITDWFASMQRVGGKIPWKKDYITLEPGRQIYNLATESSLPYIPGSRRIHRVMWCGRPELFNRTKISGSGGTLNGDDVLNNNNWSFTQNGLNYGSSPLSYLGYAFDTILMMQSQETRNKIYFSDFFHNISGDMLEISAMPGSKSLPMTAGTRVFYYYWDERDVLTGQDVTAQENSAIYQDSIGIATGTEILNGTGTTGIPSNQYNLIANPLDMSINLVAWSQLSSWARTWIWEWTFARCKYIQGSKWRKIKKIFSSGEMEYELEFDYQSLLSEAEQDMTKLTDSLRADLESMNLSNLFDQQSKQLDNATKANTLRGRLWRLM